MTRRARKVRRRTRRPVSRRCRPSFPQKKSTAARPTSWRRKNQPVELKAVEVEVFEYRLKEISGSIARFIIECSSGTYIRSLAHEMGQKLGCGAHLAEISPHRRRGIFAGSGRAAGRFSRGRAPGQDAESCVIRLENLLPNFPRMNVLPVIERRVRHGSKFNVSLRANPARPSGAAARRHRATRWRRTAPAAVARFQSARQTDRHRRSRCPTHLPARCGFRSAALGPAVFSFSCPDHLALPSVEKPRRNC